MANELASSTSPYLRAHADNPVNWRMWSKEALAEAADRDVPVLISIGYSTCHWCHVMAHESFEDEAIAALINERFVAIKIDREELPDIDAYYMNALQAMRGQGGWPMTIFATPEGSPFYAGTYFPPAPRGNLPAFTQVLSAVSQTWTDKRAEVAEMTQRMDRGLADMATAVTDALPAEASAESLSAEELDAAAEALLDSYDPAWGGFGSAPKFPPMMNILQLLATFVRLGGIASAKGDRNDATGSGDDRADGRIRDALAPTAVDWLGTDGHLQGELVLDCLIAVRGTFARIASGGMRDQVRGGIARYSVDRQWFVPHFEKMLYDNALYLRAAVAWAKVERALNPASKWLSLAEREIADTADFLLEDMRQGQRFIAALDADSADSAGAVEEGAAYVLTPEEFAEVGGAGLLQLVDSPAGADLSGQVVAAIRIIDWLGMEDVPFDADHPAPWATAETDRQRAGLRDVLDRRARPARDEKAITEWNSLAVTALAEAALYSGDDAASDRWSQAATAAWTAMHHSFGAGESGTGRPAGEGAAAAGSAANALEVRRSFTGDMAGPGAAGLADWAQFITAGLTLRQLDAGGDLQVGGELPTGGASESEPPGPGELASLGSLEELVSLSERMFAEFTAAGEVLEVFDSLGDEILTVRSSDPVDNTVPSGRSAAGEVALLLAEAGIESSGEAGSPSAGVGTGSTGGLTTGRLLELRERLLGVYRALAARAPRGCGHGLWQAERALAPVRVASRDAELRAIAARHPALTLLTASTGVPDGNGRDVAVPAGAAIVCRGTDCSLPVTTGDALESLLDG